MPGTVNFHTRPSSGPPQHHTARDHVMQRLLPLRDARHDVADEHGNHVRYDLAEVPPRCARKAVALPTHISDDQAQRFLPHGSLPLRAFHQSMVEPGHDQAHDSGKKNKTDDQEKPSIPQLFLRMNLAQESAQSGQKDQRNQNQHYTETNDDIVDDVRQQSQPKSSVLHALNRGIRRGRSRHAHHRRPRCSNHQKRLPAVWAKRRPFRQRRATFGTVHGVSLLLLTSHENAKTRKNAGQILLSSRHAVNHDPCRSLSPPPSGTRHFALRHGLSRERHANFLKVAVTAVGGGARWGCPFARKNCIGLVPKFPPFHAFCATLFSHHYDSKEVIRRLETCSGFGWIRARIYTSRSKSSWGKFNAIPDCT